eukprot:8428356-Pyramimonas_sp.AAC.1
MRASASVRPAPLLLEIQRVHRPVFLFPLIVRHPQQPATHAQDLWLVRVHALLLGLALGLRRYEVLPPFRSPRPRAGSTKKRNEEGAAGRLK